MQRGRSLPHPDGSQEPGACWIGPAHCAVRGYLLIPVAITCIVQGDPATAERHIPPGGGVARRFVDRDLAAVACHGRGRALIRLGRIAEGVALFDEAMASVIAGEVTSHVAGDVYCSVLEGCRETFDLRRAYEWTASLAQWCATQPDLVRYRGECLLYRAEVLELRGQWNEAARDAQSACDSLSSRASAGAALYRCGDLHRLRGEFTKAEEAYTRAHERGRKPQPGLSLLRLAQGQIDAAAASIKSALLDTQEQIGRARLLPAAVEILLGADDFAAARAASAELSAIALLFGAPLLAAAPRTPPARYSLPTKTSKRPRHRCGRRARPGVNWRCRTDAHTRLLLAAICEKRGDQDSRRLEFETARRLFTQLDAVPWLARIAEQSERASSQRSGSLSEREAQVLRLVAAGKTNHAIADELFISEKTVARHVSNIFDKLGVSNRAGATAWAFQHNLL